MTRSTRQDRLHWQTRIFVLTWTAYAAFYLCRKNFAVAMPLLADSFGFSRTDFARILFCDSLAYCLAQFGFGFLADRIGARRTVTLGFAITAAAAWLMAGASSVWAFACLGALNGLGQAAGWPGLVKNVSPWFSPRVRGVVMSWWSTNYMVGGFLGTVLTAYVATHPTLLPELTWRRAFLFPAAILVVVALAYALLVRDRPSDAGLPEEADAPAPLGRTASAGMLHDPSVWAIAAGSLFSKIIRYSFMFWLPLYLVQHLHYEARESGFLSSAFELAGPVGALVAGYLSDRLMKSRRFPVAAVMFGGLAIACWIHPLLAAASRVGLVLSVALLGALNHGPDALLQGAAAQDLGAKWGTGLVAGFVSGFATLGQLIAPFLVASVAGRYGWDGVFHLFSVLALAAGILLGCRWKEALA